MGEEKETVEIKLTKPEAIVLFEFLSRFSERDKLEILDQAEERVLWNVCAILERDLAEPFKHEYKEMLLKARNEVRDKD
jgi:hypothetical protein